MDAIGSLHHHTGNAASTPRKPLKEWSSVEVKRWTSNLPIKGLKAVVEEVLADIDGVTLAGLADEDLSAAGMTSKVPKPPAAGITQKTEADLGFRQA